MSKFAKDALVQRYGRRLLGSVATTTGALALAAGMTLAGFAGVLAQESTPAASPAVEVECVPRAEVTAEEPAAASPAASPTEGAAQGTPADEALATEAIGAVENYIACFNAGDLAAALSLTTPEYLMDLFGTADIDQLEAALGMVPLPQTEILSIGNVLTYDDGRVSVDAEYMSGPYQYVRSRTYLVQRGDGFLIDGEDYLPSAAEGDATIISYSIADDTTPLAFDQSTTTVEFPVVILYGANNGAERHSVLLVRLPDETAGTPVAELPAEQMMGGELIGSVIIEAGERAEMVLVDLPVGTYALIDPLVPGSVAEFTVTEPEPES